MGLEIVVVRGLHRVSRTRWGMMRQPLFGVMFGAAVFLFIIVFGVSMI